MTARLLLRLREWEEKSENGTKNRVSTETIDFVPGRSRSMFDDFGNDPIRYVR